MKKLFLFVFVFFMLFRFEVSADSYNYNQRGESVLSQSGYIAEKAVCGKDLGISELNSPNDIFISDEKVYIADSGNNRIICFDSELENVLEIYSSFKNNNGSETVLQNPSGIFADSEKIYIADTDNSRILVSDFNCNIILEIEIPSDTSYNYNTFIPEKVIADNYGNIYADARNISSGAVMFSPQGEFLGFFGANRTDKPENIVIETIKNIFRSDTKKLRRERNIPSGISGFDIDSGNFIYTCTQSGNQDTDIIKKLNPAGQNLFMYNTNTFGDYPYLYSQQEKNMFCDIDVDENQYINCLDFRYGRIFTYDKDGNLLFVSGGKSSQLGGFERVSAIECYRDSLFVLDSMKSSVTVFKKTDFGKLVDNAEMLYNSGNYSESLELWKEILVRDSNYLTAYSKISSIFLVQRNYSEAMKYAETAELSDIYNKAFEGWRENFISENFGFIIIAFFVITAMLIKMPLPKLKKNIRNSVFILIAFFIAVIADGTLYGLQFRSEEQKVFNIIPYFIKSIGIVLLWCVSGRACGTFLDGCGTFRNIFIRTSFAVIPYTIQLIVNTILSHILIRDEHIFMDIIQIAGIIWTLILVFNSVREVHHYSFKETFIAVIMTVFGITVMLFLMILVLCLLQQIYLFFISVFTEISYRIRS